MCNSECNAGSEIIPRGLLLIADNRIISNGRTLGADPDENVRLDLRRGVPSGEIGVKQLVMQRVRG